MVSTVHYQGNSDDDRVDCILFDLDGTLIDTTDLIFTSYRHALTAVLGQTASLDELFLGYGRPLAESFGAILANRQIQLPQGEHQALLARLIVAYREFNVANHDALAREFPGVRTTLDELARRGYALGLVTSKAREMAERGVRLAGLAGQFRVMVFLEDTERHKPHPDPLWFALDRLDRRQTPRRSMYVGDSVHDLRAGRTAGVRTAGALWGPFPRESLAAEEPDYLLASSAELLDIFKA